MPYFLYSLTSTELPTGGDRDSHTILKHDATQEKKTAKKKNRSRKNRGAKSVSNQTLSEQPNYTQLGKLKTQHASTQTTTDQSESRKDVSTQTPPFQCIHIHPTESKSTQTTPKRLTFKQIYEGKFDDQAHSSESERDLQHLTMLTWNIDGLDPEDARERLSNLLFSLGK